MSTNARLGDFASTVPSAMAGPFMDFVPFNADLDPNSLLRPQYVPTTMPMSYFAPLYVSAVSPFHFLPALPPPPPPLQRSPPRHNAGPHRHQYDLTIASLANRRGSVDSHAPVSASDHPKGPPRRPRQSGHSVWVGNLSPTTTVVDLKDHFSVEAAHEIESVFFIAKSNCAFVNYNSHAACRSAVERFDERDLLGHRLPCKLRSTAPSASPSTGDDVGADGSSAAGSPAERPTSSRATANQDIPIIANGSYPPSTKGATMTPAIEIEIEIESADKADRFFIMKSLTVQDLVESVRNRNWQTQAHNEEMLNEAFRSAANVYLVFSANRSGEFFGFARMGSQLYASPDSVKPSIEKASMPTSGPHSTFTTATATAPAGWIYDDHVRGTIFWEAAAVDRVASPAGVAGGEASRMQFDVEWLSTLRLQFHRTRGVRNPWNEDREVKIARDGTELEPAAGRRLVRLFNPANWNIAA